MKKITILPILCLALLFAPKAFGWELSWYNDIQVFQQDGVTPIGPGGLVQLIVDVAGDGIDDPFTWWMGQADPAAAMNAWLAAGCPPIDDDVLVVSTREPNPTKIMDFSGDPGYDPAVMDGYFGALISSSNPVWNAGKKLYTRFFTAENPAECDWYGEDELTYSLNNEFFNEYAVHGGVADQHIDPGIPEPATVSMLLGGIGLLLGFFRKRK
jgi:hypothetical protein